MSLVDAFTQSVEAALEQLNQPAVLGRRSALAAPYFLGRYLDADPGTSTVEGRGKVLVNLLRQAATTLSDDHRMVLNVAYFEVDQHPALNELRASELHRSLRTYYRDRTAAVQALATALGRMAIPPLRSELPRVKNMVGRAGQLSAALSTLRAGQSLAITGPGGAGKTTLGAHIAAEWANGMHFWFTVRPGFTDNTTALLFSLCHYLRGMGATSAWHQLIADAGKNNAPLALSHIRPMLRHDLEQIQESEPNHPLLICIDEIDLLNPQHEEHDRVLDVIRELRDLVSLLIIGQNLVIDTDRHIQLAGLETGDIAEMMRHEPGMPLSSDEVTTLAVATRGLPALVHIFILLHQMGETVTGTLSDLESGMSTDALFQRAWTRLKDPDRHLLMQLAVFDGVAPADEWPDQGELISSLASIGLLEVHTHQGIAVASYVRPAVLRRIPSQLRPILHVRAAETLDRRGEYTAAALQYQRAQQPFKAIALWSDHRAEEIERGQSQTALALLRDITPEALQNEHERRILFALRAELYKKLGVFSAGLDELSSTTWPTSHPLTPYTETLRGDLYEFSGSIEAATASYEQALRALAGQHQAREVDVYNKLGFIHLYRARNLDLARQEALQARFRSESFHGKVLEEQGDFSGANERYQAAGALLDQLTYATPMRAMNESDRGRIAMTLGLYDEAIARMQSCIQLYAQVGDLALCAVEHMNLSFTLNAAGQYEQALQIALSQLQFAQDRGDNYLISALSCNAAEACARLNRLEDAEAYAMLALRQEEAFHLHYILTVQGIIHDKRKSFTQAEQHFSEAIRMAQESEDPFGEAPAWRWLALTQWQKGRLTEARHALEQARGLYLAMGMLHEVRSVEQLSAQWKE